MTLFYQTNTWTSQPQITEETKKIWEHIRSEEHTSELQSRLHLVCRLLLEKKKTKKSTRNRVRKYKKEHA